MPGERIDPITNFRFIVEIDGVVRSNFNEVILPEIVVNTIAYRDGSDLAGEKKLSGPVEYTNLILKGSITSSLELFNWIKMVKDGNVREARRNLSVILMDEMNNQVARWDMFGAFPIHYQVSPLDAQGQEVVMEILEIAVEGIQRVE